LNVREIEDTHPVEGFAHACLLTFSRFYRGTCDALR